MSAQIAPLYAEMANSYFSFAAFTRILIGMADSVPGNLAGDHAQIRAFLLEPENRAAMEIYFSGQITIYRGEPEIDRETGLSRIPMQVVSMEEYGYAASLKTTIRMTADFERPNFGLTHQLSTADDLPAEARMLMTLKFSAVGGDFSDRFNSMAPAVAKEIQASISAFPFTDAGTVFRHVGNEAREIKAADGSVMGYLADGTMVPQHQIENPKEDLHPGLWAEQKENISAAELRFLTRRVASVVHSQ